MSRFSRIIGSLFFFVGIGFLLYSLYVFCQVALSEIPNAYGTSEAYGLLFMGAIFLFFGIMILFVIYVDDEKLLKAIKNNTKVVAKVTNLVQDNSVGEYQVKCEYKNEYSRKVYKFTSSYLKNNPKGHVNIGDEVDVYVVPDDYKIYKVDLSRYGVN